MYHIRKIDPALCKFMLMLVPLGMSLEVKKKQNILVYSRACGESGSLSTGTTNDRLW